MEPQRANGKLAAMKSTRLTLILAAALMVAAPVTAEAKKPGAGGFQQATFKATLSGSQVTTWEYHTPLNEDDPCSASSDGYGDQTIKFTVGHSFKITFNKPPKSQPNLFVTNGRPAILTTPLILPLQAHAERNGDYTVNYHEIRSNCDGAAGGGGDTNLPPKDCGVRDGSFNARLFFHDPNLDEEITIPSRTPLPEKNTLKLEGNYYQWSKADGSGPAATLDETYQHCPLLLEDTYVEKAGNIFTSPAKLPEKQLFNKKRRKIVVSGHHIEPRGNGGSSTGQTILAWNLRLTRVK
jgi:hypothetical protein